MRHFAWSKQQFPCGISCFCGMSRPSCLPSCCTLMQNGMSLTSHVTTRSLMYDAKWRLSSLFEDSKTKARHTGIIYSFTVGSKENLNLNIEVLWSWFYALHYKMKGDRFGTVVKVLCYNSEGRWFDCRCCHRKFSLTYSSRSHYDPGVDRASNRNEYQEHFLGVKAAGA